MLFAPWNVIIAQKLCKFIQIEKPVRNRFWYQNRGCYFLKIFEDLDFEVEKLSMLISSIFEVFWWFKVQNASTFITIFTARIRSARGRVHVRKIHHFQQITHKKYRINAVNFFHDNFLARERLGARWRFQIWKVWWI